MAYAQLRDVLDRLKTYHARLDRLYGEAAEDAQDERARLLLDDMQRQEGEVAARITRFLHEDPLDVLNTWIQYDSNRELDEAVRNARFHADMTADAVYEEAMRVEGRFRKLYEQLRSASAAPRVRELFDALIAMDEAKEARYSRDVLESP